MNETIGVGVVGLSAHGNWGALAHYPAIQAVPGVELRGLIAGSPASTAAASERYGVPGFASVAELAERDDIDLVTIAVRVPEHRRLLEPILGTGKAILCEWPLALDLAEAEDLAAGEPGGPRLTGLQGHVSPVIRWMHELLREGYVGELRSSSMLLSFPGGGPTFTSGSAYTADAANGATMLTIPFAHALDMQNLLVGGLDDISSTIVSQQTEAVISDTGTTIPKTSPDQIAVTGRLPGGAVASMHFRAASYRTTPFLWEIDGVDGSLRITGDLGLPMSETLTVEGARGRDSLAPIALPDGYDRYPDLARTPAHNVAHLYDDVAATLGGRGGEVPTFADGAELHRALEAITAAARRVAPEE